MGARSYIFNTASFLNRVLSKLQSQPHLHNHESKDLATRTFTIRKAISDTKSITYSIVSNDRGYKIKNLRDGVRFNHDIKFIFLNAFFVTVHFDVRGIVANIL